MKGKGAKIFEKQQKRMDRYTKESSGAKDPSMTPIPFQACDPGANLSSQQASVDPTSRSRMNDVMGEFRRMSDSELPVRNLFLCIHTTVP